MDAGVWGAVLLSLAVVIAGGIAWWIGRECIVTTIGAAGSILGAVAALVVLVILPYPDSGLRVASSLTIAAGVWLLGWALAGGIRGDRAERALRAAEAAAAVEVDRREASLTERREAFNA